MQIADERKITVLGLTHLNKKIDVGHINRMIGSRAWSAVPRMVWAIKAEYVDDGDGKKETDVRFLIPVKYNLIRRPKAFQFILHDTVFEMPRIEWLTERIEMDADDTGQKPDQTKQDEACFWLAEFLKHSQKDNKRVKAEASLAGIKQMTLARARVELGVVVEVQGKGKDRVSLWGLPNLTEGKSWEGYDS